MNTIINQIIDPNSRTTYLLHSKQGKQLLKGFINRYNQMKIGGMQELEQNIIMQKKKDTEQIIKLDTNKFSILHFGCWNNDYCISNKLDFPYIITTYNINLFLVNGDNIYPDSVKLPEKLPEVMNTKDWMQSLPTQTKGKYKEYNEQKIKDGFNCLSQIDFKKNVSLGNHDLLDNNPMYTTDEKDMDWNCPIIRKQKELIDTNQDHFRFPYSQQTYKMLNGKTISVIYINIDLYKLQNIITNQKTKPLELEKAYENIRCVYNYDHDTQNKLEDHLTEKHQQMLSDYISKIVNLQNDFINNQLSTPQNYYIIVTHEPFLALKQKKKNDITLTVENLLTLFNNPKYAGKNISYLCADTHLYQEGIITFSFDNIKPLSIHQIIAGTGGADLDKCPKTMNQFEKGTITYEMKDCVSSHGIGIYQIDTTTGEKKSTFIPVES